MNEDKTKSDPGAGQPAGGLELKHREAVLLEMGKSLRALSIYPARHPQRANLLGQAFGSIQVVVSQLGDLTYQVARNGFVYFDAKLGTETPMIRDLAQEMHLRQVKSFSLRRELSLPDFSAFLELLLEDPEKFRKGRFIEQWIRSHEVQSVWVNEIDFSHLVNQAGAEEAEAGPEPEAETVEQHLEELLRLLAAATDPDPFTQLLREAELLVRPLLEQKDYDLAWRVVAAISNQGEEERRPGPKGELIRPLAVRSVRGMVKGEFLARLLERYSLPEEGESMELYQLFLQLSPGPLVDGVMEIVSRNEPMNFARPLLDLTLKLGGQAREPLEAHLASEAPGRVRKAAFLLGELRDRAAAPALKATLEHPDDKVRREGVRALARLRSLEASRALIGALASERDPEIKVLILQALGENKDLASVPALLKAFAQTPLREDTVAIQEAIIEALGRIGSRETLPLLIRALNRWSLFKKELGLRPRIKAAEALGRMGGEPAMQALARYARGGEGPLQKTCTAVLEALIKNNGRPLQNLEEVLK